MHAKNDARIDAVLFPAIALSLALLIGGALFRYVSAPLLREVLGSRKSLSAMERSITQEDGRESLKAVIAQKRALLEEKRKELTSGMGDPRDLSGLLQMIFDKAWKEGILFTNTAPHPETVEGNLVQYPILFEMETDYHSFARFIGSLEQAPQLLHIDRIAMSALQGEKIGARLQITCFLHDEK